MFGRGSHVRIMMAIVGSCNVDSREGRGQGGSRGTSLAC